MVAFAVMGDRFRQPHQFVGGVGLGQRFDFGHAPVFATGLNSARVPNPAISGRPFAIAACTAGSLSDAACASLLSQSRSEEHTSELQSLQRISYAVFCLQTKNHQHYL